MSQEVLHQLYWQRSDNGQTNGQHTEGRTNNTWTYNIRTDNTWTDRRTDGQRVTFLLTHAHTNTFNHSLIYIHNYLLRLLLGGMLSHVLTQSLVYVDLFWFRPANWTICTVCDPVGVTLAKACASARQQHATLTWATRQI